MTTPRFSSFEEIDIRLEMLAVERKISLYRLRAGLEKAVGSSLRSGLHFAWKPVLRTLAVSLAVKAIKRRLAARYETA